MMKQFSLFLLVLSSIACSLSIHAQSDRFVCDESCDPGSSGVAKFNVVSPVGFSTVEPIEMSPRLQTLDGKTIAIVGEDFMYNITLITEPVANILASGYSTIDGLEDALIQNSRRSAYERTFANYYANPGSRKDGEEHTFNQYFSHIVQSEGGEETTTPIWYDTQATTMTTIPTMEKGSTAFLVTGDASRNKVQTMPGGGFSTVAIDLPAGWDSLMKAKGYPALSEMFLAPTSNKSNSTTVKSSSKAKTKGSPLRREYYDFNGRRTNHPLQRAYIERTVYQGGMSNVTKRMR